MSQSNVGGWTRLSTARPPVGAGAIAVVSAVLVGVYALPDPLRRELSFAYAEPTLVTAYTAHFVHLTVSHLLSNLAAFLVVATTAYYLSARAGRAGAFVRLVATLLVAFPIALSGLNLAVPRDGVMYGFSGLNMALVGFLPAVIATYVGRRRDAAIDGVVLLVAFLGSAVYVATIGTPRSGLTDAVVLVALASVLVIGFARYLVGSDATGNRIGLGLGTETGTAAPSRFAGVDAPAVAAVVVWVVFLSIGFPETVAADGRVTNVYVHFLGYALGFITAYLAYECRLLE